MDSLYFATMLKRIFPALFLVIFGIGCASRNTTDVLSPDGKIAIHVATGEQTTYSVAVDKHPLLSSSALGLKFDGSPAIGPAADLVSSSVTTSDKNWENPIGIRRNVRDHYNQLRLVMKSRSTPQTTFELIFRAYDDGVAFRYALPESSGHFQVLTRELTEFSFAQDARCYAGSQLNGFGGPQEWEFWPTHLAALPADRPTGLPLLVHTSSEWVAVTESDLLDYPGMWVTTSDTPPPPPVKAKHTAQTPPPANSPLVANGVTLFAHLAPRHDGHGLAQINLPHAMPWRVLMIANEPGKLMESDLISNLASPSQLKNASWIKPGMMAWDHWWSGDVQMDTATIKQYIQLAGDMRWPYQLIDWQWYLNYSKPNADIMKINPKLDMPEVLRFAKERNVRLWLWLHWTDVDRNDAYKKAFALYESWGIAGVKIDFMDRDDQEMVNWYEKITRAAAEHHLMVNFHGAFKGTGLNRTLPNQITREGVLGNEYNRWSDRVTPEHKLMLPFTRDLAGPADFTPGGFQNRQPGQFKVDKLSAQVQGTRCAQLALFVTYFSPIMCACDHPDYYKNQPGADFLKIVPTVWDDTRVLSGSVGEHLLIVRKSHDGDFFLGALTDRSPRTMDVKLDFLPPGKWTMRLWKDAADSDVNAEHLYTETRTVSRTDAATLRLARCGGAVAQFHRE